MNIDTLFVINVQNDNDSISFLFCIYFVDKFLRSVKGFLGIFILRKKCYWIKSISFQKHVYQGLKSIFYRISNIFIGLVVYFYELIVCMLLERNAFDLIAFVSQCIIDINFDDNLYNIYIII